MASLFIMLTRNVNILALNMGGRAVTLEVRTKRNPNTFPSSLAEFCVDSVSTCFSRDADKLCVPIAISALSALLLLLSCSLLVCQRCRSRAETPREIITFFYSLLGNLCSTVGAILSTRLHLQILMGTLSAAVDAVHFVSLCFPVVLGWNSKAERRRRMLRRRRRQHLLAVSVLMVVGGGFLRSRVAHSPADRPIGRRTLLHDAAFQEDYNDILGYILGLLSLVIAFTSRFPALRRAYRGQKLTWAHMTSGLLCSLSGALYAAAILLDATQFGFLLRVMPWLLSAICCVTLDLLILVIHWCKRTTARQLILFSPDTESLLDLPSEDNGITKTQKKRQDLPSAQTKTKQAQKKTEMGRYMDVSVQPASKEVTLSKEKLKRLPVDRMIRTGLDAFLTSDTSCDSSLSSDLEAPRLTTTRENSLTVLLQRAKLWRMSFNQKQRQMWDFEQWSEPKAKKQEGGEFPLQGLPTNPDPSAPAPHLNTDRKLCPSDKRAQPSDGKENVILS